MRFDVVVSRISDIEILKPATKKAAEERVKAKVYVLRGVRKPATLILREENGMVIGDRLTVSVSNTQAKLNQDGSVAPPAPEEAQ